MTSRTFKIILASNSPRRKELLSGLDVNFEVRVLAGIDESYPASLPTMQIAEYISKKKAAAYRETMAVDELVITADTVVILGDEVMGKPKDDAEACRMLRELSGFSVKTDVTFKELTNEEIHYYVEKYHPMDKAGAYGIQEWIGHIGVTGLRGSFYNVMGFPVQRVYNELSGF